MTNRRRFVQSASAAVAFSALRGATSDPGFVTAMDGVRAAIPVAASDPDRPVCHFHPPANWNNDPNGTLFYKGWHHLFYQLNPFAPRGGNQHWGHARSRDLVNWEHLPIAMWPSSDKGERALFSGGAIIAKDGRPRIIYTSIGQPQPQQWMAFPQDDELIGWEKYSGNPVLTQAAHPRNVNQWRDPFMFHEAGQTYMVCGGNADAAQGGHGQVQLYRAATEDLTAWKHLGVVFEYRDRETWNIECPNLFKLDGKWVLLISPQRPCEYFIGDLDLARAKFVPDTHGVLDPGDAYASNISVDDKGRTILWLWGRTNTPQEKGWNGVMTLPRILSIGADGYLREQVAPEFAMLRGEAKRVTAAPLTDKALVLEGISGDVLEIEAEFAAGNSSAFGLELRRSGSGRPAFLVAVQRGTLSVGSYRIYIGYHDRYKLSVFLDKRCVEVFLNDGFAAVYSAVEADHADQSIAVFSRASAPSLGASGRGPAAPVRLESLTVWPLKPAVFSLDRFHV